VPSSIPFDHARLDELLGDAGLDAIIATSPHNVRYLLGGYEFFMYALADSIGLSRYLPAIAYRRQAPAESLYVGAGNEQWATDVEPIWAPEVRTVSWGAGQTAQEVCDWARSHLKPHARVGVELPYLPAEAYVVLQRSGRELCDATELLETLRAVKRPHELDIVRRASAAVVDAILETFRGSNAGDSKADVFDRLRREETRRGLTFCYALVAAGAELNRAPSPRRLAPGDVVSLDSGGTYRGWVADLTRMGVVGEPTLLQKELLSQVDYVQQATRKQAVAGTRGGEIFEAARKAIGECADRQHLSFLAHGTGLVTHEAPRLTATGSPPYPAAHAELPLEAGMVLSIESQVADPAAGFIKLEDTIIVGERDSEAVGDHGRGWNRIGA
jgi:Xaa-Pro aminopeptidase